MLRTRFISKSHRLPRLPCTWRGTALTQEPWAPACPNPQRYQPPSSPPAGSTCALCPAPPGARARPAPPGVPRAAHVTPPPAIGRAGGAGPPRCQRAERGLSRLLAVAGAAGRSAVRAERQALQAWAPRTLGERPRGELRRQECGLASRGGRCAGPALSRDRGVRRAGHPEGAGPRRPHLLRSRGRGRSQRDLFLLSELGRAREGCRAPLKLGEEWGNTHPHTTRAIRKGVALLGTKALEETEALRFPGGSPRSELEGMEAGR